MPSGGGGFEAWAANGRLSKLLTGRRDVLALRLPWLGAWAISILRDDLTRLRFLTLRPDERRSISGRQYVNTAKLPLNNPACPACAGTGD